jgi:tetratricopeptide (TPR) repeat protein
MPPSDLSAGLRAGRPHPALWWALCLVLVACRQEAAPPPVPAAPRPDPAAANTACADCHPDEAAQFKATGMGRSLAPAAQAPVIEDYTRAEVIHAPSGFRYRALRDAEGRLWQEERPLADPTRVRRIEATHIVGSGNHARTYLGLADGHLVELPLTWYSGRKAWDMSPGYERPDQWRFGRPIKAPCLFCHNGLTPLLPETIASYEAPLAHGIGCDRCHGDGAQHATQRQAGQGPPAGQADESIFNPGRAPPERQLQICQQCHLQGEATVLHTGRRWDEADPRRPLSEHLSIYRRLGESSRGFTVASHGHRMRLSACATDARLVCTTCHNPHREATQESHRQACLGCHAPKQAVAKQSEPAKEPASPAEKGSESGGLPLCPDPAAGDPTQACHACHMTRGGTLDVPHVHFTDHFIRRRPLADAPGAAPSTTLVDLVEGAAPAEGLDARLRQGLAHTLLWERKNLEAHLPEAIRVLEAVVREAPADHPGLGRAWAALGRSLARQGRHADAVAAFERVRDPDMDDAARLPEDHAASLVALGRIPAAQEHLHAALLRRPTARRALQLGQLLQRTGQLATAADALEMAIKLSTYDPEPPTEAAHLALQQGDMATARRHLERALARDPVHLPALLSLSLLEVEAGRFDQALLHLDLVLRRDPRAASGYGLRALAHEQMGQVDLALADYTRAADLEPHQPEAHLAAARLALSAQRFDVARALLANATRRLPNEPRLRALIEQLPPR